MDYEKAFDKVWHTGLWIKLARCGVGGDFLKVIMNMYKDITSCVTVNGNISDPFHISQGVRQGENLSPFLFALYINDLEEFLLAEGCSPVDMGIAFDDRVSDYLKILITIYADDTVIFAESETQLQKALDKLDIYCRKWKLSVNCSKTKIMTFGGKKNAYQYPFKFQGKLLENVSSFKYLGLTFNFNGKFNLGVKHLKEQGRRAMMALLRRSRQLELPVSTQLDLFNTLVRPVLTYSCEVWGYSCVEIVEALHLEYCKYVLHLKKSTPDCFVYGETGQFPLYIHIYSRMVKFWHKLVTGNSGKYSAAILHTLLECLTFNIYSSDWLLKIQQILNECGLSFVWNFPHSVSTKWLDATLTQKLKDIFLQKWAEKCNVCRKGCHYSLFKSQFGFECYLDDLPQCYRIALTKLRTSNHKLPVEKGRYANLPRDQRFCTLCNTDQMGDEYHFLLECPSLADLRTRFIPRYYSAHPNFFKYSELLTLNKKKETLNLSKFAFHGMKFFK